MRANSGSSSRPLGRRQVLKIASVGVMTGVAGTLLSQTGRAQQEAAITFEDQTTDGRSITLARVATDQPSFLQVRGGDRQRGQKDFSTATVVTDLTITLSPPLTESMPMSASLYPRGGGESIARDTAQITVKNPPESVEGMEVTKIDATPEAGFQYPYFLYAPRTYGEDSAKPILVEPNNTGTSTDDFGRHLEAVRRRMEQGVGRRIADALFAPFLMPVFPRPRSEPVDVTHYVHQLDRDTLAIEEGPLERVDKQLLAMVEDARQQLPQGYPVADGMMLNGFSAAGNFVNRFAALHPSEVRSVTAGGINGMPILPIEEAKGHTLRYHLGVADIGELTGSPFDLEAFRDVPQFLYMGELDSSDTIGYNDAWTDPELEQAALDVFGHDMIYDRLPFAKAVYEDVDAASVFRVYEGATHTPRPAIPDLIEFHERSLAGEDITAIRRDLGGNVPNVRAYISYAPRRPVVGEQVAFDATRSRIWNTEIVSYEWAFGDEATATGPLATHTFETHGGHNVRLTVTDETESTHQSVAQVVVERPPTTATAAPTPSSDTTPTPTRASTETPPSNDTPGQTGPGFGIGVALSGIAGMSYLMAQYLPETD